MKVYFKEVIVRTQKRRELVDITHEVEHAVDASGISNGLCLVFVPHATAAVVANEHEKGLMNDILRKLEEEYPINGEWE
ncbi:MAG: YjbQ family protein, partial [Thermofilaceae archaeon]